jgi:hypothetical protein
MDSAASCPEQPFLLSRGRNIHAYISRPLSISLRSPPLRAFFWLSLDMLLGSLTLAFSLLFLIVSATPKPFPGADPSPALRPPPPPTCVPCLWCPRKYAWHLMHAWVDTCLVDSGPPVLEEIKRDTLPCCGCKPAPDPSCVPRTVTVTVTAPSSNPTI